MQRILSSDEMYACDAAAIHAGTPSRTLMTRAARACADFIKDHILPIPPIQTAEQQKQEEQPRVIVVCGTGNNGGDGICCARLLMAEGIDADVLLIGKQDAMSKECWYQYDAACNEMVHILDASTCMLRNYPYCCIVDAIFGIGLNKPIRGLHREVIQEINAYAEKYHVPIVSIDIPSGVNGNTGQIMAEHGASPVAVRAAHTLAISNLKCGHLLYPGAAYMGDITVLDIGIPLTPLKTNHFNTPTYVLTDEDLKQLPQRLPDSNKGTYGRILVIAGAKNMCGAAYLAAKAAYRTGAGLVEILTVEDNRIPLQTLLPEAVLTTYTPDADNVPCWAAALARASTVILGPGLGTDKSAAALTRFVLEHSFVPTVVDADALNIIAAEDLLPCIDRRPDVPWLLTPHPGELSRLTGRTIPELKAHLVRTADQFAREHHVTLIAKDTRSVITDGRTAYINTTGCSALAKGGSGDTLTGISAVLLAQSPADTKPVFCAALAAYIHGRAGEAAAKQYGERSPLAGEVCDCIADVLRQ